MIEKMDILDYCLSVHNHNKYGSLKDYEHKIINQIIYEECKKNNLDYEHLKVYVLTKYEYYKNILKNKTFKLDGEDMALSIDFVDFCGFCDYKKRIIVILLNNNVINNMIKVVNNTCHEVSHYEHFAHFNSNDPICLAFIMDNLIRIYDKKCYYFNHDQLMLEILANKEGVLKAQTFIEKNNVEGLNYAKDLEYLQIYEEIYSYDLNNYNYLDVFDRFINIYRLYNKKIELPSFLEIFLNKDGTFRDLKNIIKDSKVDIDNISLNIAMIMCSNTFDKEVFAPYFKGDGRNDIQIMELYNQLNFFKSQNEQKIIEINQCFFEQNYECNFDDNLNIYLSLKQLRLEKFESRYHKIITNRGKKKTMVERGKL